MVADRPRDPLAGVARETERLATVDRVLVFVAALGFVPVIYELIMGQVTMLIAAALYPVRERDGHARGIGSGIVLALFAKPMLLPVLLWMLAVAAPGAGRGHRSPPPP